MRFFVRLVALWCLAGFAVAAIESYEFENEEQRARYHQLTEELRCPKCQNQNLADSDSQIAADLRRELHAQLLAGKSDEAVVDFMRERYGDFVLYKPRVQSSTLVLWFAPLALVLLVFAGLWWTRRSDGNRSSDMGSDPVGLTPEHLAPAGEQYLSSRTVHVMSFAVLLLVAVASLLLYRHFGAMRAVAITESAHAVFSGQMSGELLARQQEALLADLDAWLEHHPDHEKFLYMRARLLGEAGQWTRAETDYQSLLSRFPDQDSLLAEYAQLLFLKNDRALNGDAAAFLQQALQINPHNVTALGLLGMQAFESAQYRQAVDYWQRLLVGLPADSPQAATIASGIARARELGQLGADTASADVQITVQVSVATAVQAKPDELVFVLLRAVQGPRMPLAVVRTTVAALAQPVLLDTAQSPMRGQIDVASIGAFEVVARVSRSGQPIPAAGDWEGVSAAMNRAAWPASMAVLVDRPVTP